MLNNGEVISYGNPEVVLKGEALNNIYGIDIKNFMTSILKKWA